MLLVTNLLNKIKESIKGQPEPERLPEHLINTVIEADFFLFGVTTHIS